ncbi:hypothetical protein OF83DRAFT_1086729 [Amylostereum chailletii]|nr:hypothetical protein OF83DRAFT_1086729 [Amylostereum chailletii]
MTSSMRAHRLRLKRSSRTSIQKVTIYSGKIGGDFEEICTPTIESLPMRIMARHAAARSLTTYWGGYVMECQGVTTRYKARGDKDEIEGGKWFSTTLCTAMNKCIHTRPACSRDARATSVGRVTEGSAGMCVQDQYAGISIEGVCARTWVAGVVAGVRGVGECIERTGYNAGVRGVRGGVLAFPPHALKAGMEKGISRDARGKESGGCGVRGKEKGRGGRGEVWEAHLGRGVWASSAGVGVEGVGERKARASGHGGQTRARRRWGRVQACGRAVRRASEHQCGRRVGVVVGGQAGALLVGALRVDVGVADRWVERGRAWRGMGAGAGGLVRVRAGVAWRADRGGCAGVRAGALQARVFQADRVGEDDITRVMTSSPTYGSRRWARGGEARARGGEARARGGEARARGSEARARGGEAKARGGARGGEGKSGLQVAARGERRGGGVRWSGEEERARWDPGDNGSRGYSVSLDVLTECGAEDDGGGGY